MARIDLGLGVGGISGTVGDITGAKWRGVQYFRTCNHKPKDPADAPHYLARASLAVLVNVWKHMPADWQAAWNTFAERLQMSGFNCFVKANAKAQQTDVPVSAAPSCPGVFPVIDVVLTDAAAHKIKAAWAAGDAVATDKVNIGIWKDYHPTSMAAVVEDNGRPVFTEQDTTLVSALQKDLMPTGAAGDYLVAVAVKETATGKLSIAAFGKITIA
jgi:hypothetical protein